MICEIFVFFVIRDNFHKKLRWKLVPGSFLIFRHWMHELHNTLIFIPLVQLAIAWMANFFPRFIFWISLHDRRQRTLIPIRFS